MFLSSLSNTQLTTGCCGPSKIEEKNIFDQKDPKSFEREDVQRKKRVIVGTKTPFSVIFLLFPTHLRTCEFIYMHFYQ